MSTRLTDKQAARIEQRLQWTKRTDDNMWADAYREDILLLQKKVTALEAELQEAREQAAIGKANIYNVGKHDGIKDYRTKLVAVVRDMGDDEDDAMFVASEIVQLIESTEP